MAKKKSTKKKAEVVGAKVLVAKVGDLFYLLPCVFDGKEVAAKAAVTRAKKAGLDKFQSCSTEDRAVRKSQYRNRRAGC